MAGSDRQIEHLLRRAGFGARPDELALYGAMSTTQAANALVDYESTPDIVDSKIGSPGYVGTTVTGGAFSPQSNINHARQRWLFRMVHSDRPLQEKMTLFWHNHFATGYNKIAGALSAAEAARYLAAKATEDPGQVHGQIEMLRDNALGKFKDILLAIAKDTAMLVWLDGRTNTKAKPQENFGREIMELFTVGVGNYTEPDVYAAARVFTGWNLQRPGTAADGTQHYAFVYNAGQHETTAKTFSFAIYPDGGRTIPGALGRGRHAGRDRFHQRPGRAPEHRALPRDEAVSLLRQRVRRRQRHLRQPRRQVYLQTGGDMKSVMREVLLSPELWDQSAYFARYSWPAEFVTRALKDIGWSGFSVNDALTPMSNMGQILFEPPDVSGWDAGQSWFSTSAMLARMNFASTLAGNQKFNLATAVKKANASATPEALLAYFVDALVTAPMDPSVTAELSNYLHANGAWTGSDAQLQAKSPGVVHLIAGSPEYQFV